VIVHRQPGNIRRHFFLQVLGIVTGLVGDDPEFGRIRLDTLERVLHGLQFRGECLHLLLELTILGLQPLVFRQLAHHVHVIVNHEREKKDPYRPEQKAHAHVDRRQHDLFDLLGFLGDDENRVKVVQATSESQGKLIEIYQEKRCLAKRKA